MRWLSSFATRLMPVAFLAVAVIAVAQFWLQHAPSGHALDGYVDQATAFLYKILEGRFASRRNACHVLVVQNDQLEGIAEGK